MPSETYYLPDDDREYLREVEQARGLDNPSQALQDIVADHRAEVGADD